MRIYDLEVQVHDEVSQRFCCPSKQMQTMRKLYNQMVLEKAQIKAEPLIQIGSIKREKKDKEMAVAE